MAEVERAGDGPVRMIVGLGNPGPEYRDTRHNVGFEVVDALARRTGVAVDRLECNSLVGLSNGVLMCKPLTFMNRSGYATACLAERHQVRPEDVLVVLDEVALPLGRLRARRGGGPGGHRGLESVIENLKSGEVPRLRLGIRPDDREIDGEDLVEFVLAAFDEGELNAVRDMVGRAADACESWLNDGMDRTMNRFNS